MKAMILAAGRGERMQPLTNHTPKPLLKAGGRALIEYHLEALHRAGFKDVVINVSHLAQLIRTALGDGSAYGLRIHYSEEGHEALETGGGIHRALPLLGDEPFLVMNGDIWCDFTPTIRKLSDNDLAHLILVDNPPHNCAGDFAIHHGRLLVNSTPKFTFSGIGYYHPELFRDCMAGKFPLAPLLTAAARNNRVSAEYYPGRWNDIGTPQRLNDLNTLLAAKGRAATD
jgi:N-acetyl-alpha-D-muramate 1-phosphate uridylyltransferase